MNDITGQKFNRLLAVKPVSQNKDRVFNWEFKCDCGKTIVTNGSKVRGGYTKSCGCLKMENLKHEGPDHPQWDGYKEISKSFYSRMVKGAETRNWEWKVSIKYLWELYLKQDKKCALTGIDISMPIHLRKLTKRNKVAASLDRIDPTKGYIKGNIRWICTTVNYLKHTLNDAMFFQFIKVMYEHNKLNLLNKDEIALRDPSSQIKIRYNKNRKYKFKPVEQLDLKGNVLKEYFSVRDASEKTGINTDTLRKFCRGINTQTADCIWRYKTLDSLDN